MQKRENYYEQGISRLVILIIIAVCLSAILASNIILLKEWKNRSSNLQVEQVSDIGVPAPFIKEVIYGYSSLGKEVKGYEIGNGPESVFLFGAIHGNEKGTRDLLERMVIEIKLQPEMVSKDLRLIIIPVLNPDGFYDRTDKLNGNGVNLDLNFETGEWKKYGPEGTYAGLEPFSEPESRIVRDIVENNNVIQMISFHSRGSLVIPDDNQPSMDLAEWYALKTGYTYTGSDPFNFFGHTYFGTPTTWFVAKTGNAGVTVEITDHYSSDWERNKKALMELVSAREVVQ